MQRLERLGIREIRVTDRKANRGELKVGCEAENRLRWRQPREQRLGRDHALAREHGLLERFHLGSARRICCSCRRMRRFYVAVALCVQSRALSVSRSGVRAGAKAVAARAPAKGDRKVAARRVQAAQMDRKHQADAIGDTYCFEALLHIIEGYGSLYMELAADLLVGDDALRVQQLRMNREKPCSIHLRFHR